MNLKITFEVLKIYFICFCNKCSNCLFFIIVNFNLQYCLHDNVINFTGTTTSKILQGFYFVE